VFFSLKTPSSLTIDVFLIAVSGEELETAIFLRVGLKKLAA